ncbi:hypothetical protein GCM10027075_18250 [Streptomyces heilongjiangensis]
MGRQRRTGTLAAVRRDRGGLSGGGKRWGRRRCGQPPRASGPGRPRIRQAGFARSAANRVVFMADGRIVEGRTPDEFCTNPNSDRSEDFLSKILTH